VKHKNARFAATVFHLWHPEQDRVRLADNQKRLDDLLSSSAVRAAVGLDQHHRVCLDQQSAMMRQATT
jgi:hypothetical protein